MLGALAIPAAADDFSIGFGYRNGGRWSIGFGYSSGHDRRVVNQRWVPGHYETVSRQVWVPGACEQVWQPAQYRWAYDRCGRRVQVLVRPAGYVTVERPGHYQTVCEQVWVPGHYVRC
jgi:hypothetical protein